MKTIRQCDRDCSILEPPDDCTWPTCVPEEEQLTPRGRCCLDCGHAEESHKESHCTMCGILRMGDPFHTFIPRPEMPLCTRAPGRCPVHGRHKDEPAPSMDNLALFEAEP